jgi:hypothetical protein
MKLKFIDAEGATQEADLEVSIYREAADNQMSVPQLINTRFPTNADKHGTAFEQFMANTGMFLHADGRYGIRPPTMEQIINGTAVMNAGTIVREASPVSRILFPAVFLEAVENQLKDDTDSYVAMFDSMVAVSDSINGPRFEQPVLNYSKPEGARSQAISQLAYPPSMLSITTADVARKIPTFSIGMEISDEAKKASTLDFVALALARQAEVERAARVDEYITSFLDGDLDMGTAALTPVTAQSLDALNTTTGMISHLAWVKFLRRNYRKRHIDWVMCDLATALKIENRSGKPVVTTDNPNSNRIDALAQVANPQWQGVKIFLLEDGTIPTNTVLGLDSRYAIRRVRNNQAEYAAVEQFVLKKSEAVRYDFGEVAYRMFDDAWDVLSLVV